MKKSYLLTAESIALSQKARQVKGDQMTGRAPWSGPPQNTGSGKVSLKRVVEK